MAYGIWMTALSFFSWVVFFTMLWASIVQWKRNRRWEYCALAFACAIQLIVNVGLFAYANVWVYRTMEDIERADAGWAFAHLTIVQGGWTLSLLAAFVASIGFIRRGSNAQEQGFVGNPAQDVQAVESLSSQRAD